MLNITLMQALSLWSALEEARHGTSSFGGDTCEIYMYTVMPFTPALGQKNSTSIESPGFVGDSLREAYDQANTTLFEMLDLFAKTHRVKIEVDGKALGPWLKTARNQHRVHVHVDPTS